MDFVLSLTFLLPAALRETPRVCFAAPSHCPGPDSCFLLVGVGGPRGFWGICTLWFLSPKAMPVFFQGVAEGLLFTGPSRQQGMVWGSLLWFGSLESIL